MNKTTKKVPNRYPITCPHCQGKIVTIVDQNKIIHEPPICEEFKTAEKEFNKSH